MITIICGEPGKGKTALLTYFAVDKMINNGFEYWWKSCKRIDTLKQGGFSHLEYPPQRHTVYCDYDLQINFPSFKSYYVDGFNIALTNPFFPTAFFYPYSQIFLDEAQKYYDSRMSRYLRECVYRFYQLHRHNNLDIYMTCQRLGNIDLNIRQIAECIILVKDLKIKKDEYGRIINMKWIVLKFNSLSSAESFIDNGNKTVEYETKTYEFNGNIFKFYNSYGNEPVFYDGNYNRKYDCYTVDGYVDTIDSYIKYNSDHMYYAPVGYWKNEKRDSELLKNNLKGAA